MGFVLTLLFLISSYISPSLVFGPLAEYHIEIIIAALALLATLPQLPGSGILRAPQIIAVLGLSFAVLASLAATGWIGGAPEALYEFLPAVFSFIIVALNCRTRRRLQILTFCMAVASIFIISQGVLALQSGDSNSPWLYDQGFEGNHILRLRGLSIVHDPNDLAQVLVSLVACMFLLWRPRKLIWNSLFVLVPCTVLLFGLYLTHSRGGLLALMAVIALAVYRRFGVVPAVVMAFGVFALSTAVSFSGGREISAESGQDRMDAWSTGLELIKSHPVFGVGYRRFVEYNSITAHNTVVVCAAELGFVGFFFWVLFVVTSLREGIILRAREVKQNLSAPAQVAFSYRTPALGLHNAAVATGESLLFTRPDPAMRSSSYFAPNMEPASETDKIGATQESEADIRQMAWVVVVALFGFLVAGWFLSRAYAPWLFVYGGMSHSIYKMAERRGLTPASPSLSRLLKLSSWVAAGLLLFVYIILRVDHLMPHH